MPLSPAVGLLLTRVWQNSACACMHASGRAAFIGSQHACMAYMYVIMTASPCMFSLAVAAAIQQELASLLDIDHQ